MVVVALAGTANAQPVAASPPPPPQHRAQLRRRPPAVPTPAPEIVQLGRGIAGTYDCGTDHLTVAVELDNAWIAFRFDHAVEYRTYDGVAKQWTRVRIEAAGYHSATSLGEADGKWSWSSGETEVIDSRAITLAGLVCKRS
jgi:hypothetical protein